MIIRYANPHIDIGSLFNILVRHGSYIIQSPHLYHLSGSIPPIPFGDVDDSSPGESLQVLPGAVVGGDPPGHSHLHGATAPDSSAPGACGTPCVDRWSLGRKIFAAARIGERALLNGRRMSQICSRVWNIEFTIPLESLDHFGAYQSISCHMSVFSMVSHGKLTINGGNAPTRRDLQVIDRFINPNSIWVPRILICPSKKYGPPQLVGFIHLGLICTINSI